MPAEFEFIVIRIESIHAIGKASISSCRNDPFLAAIRYGSRAGTLIHFALTLHLSSFPMALEIEVQENSVII
jgi:hypothetical protein